MSIRVRIAKESILDSIEHHKACPTATTLFALDGVQVEIRGVDVASQRYSYLVCHAYNERSIRSTHKLIKIERYNILALTKQYPSVFLAVTHSISEHDQSLQRLQIVFPPKHTLLH